MTSAGLPAESALPYRRRINAAPEPELNLLAGGRQSKYHYHSVIAGSQHYRSHEATTQQPLLPRISTDKHYTGEERIFASKHSISALDGVSFSL